MGFSPEKMLENGNNIRQYYDIKYLIVTQGAQGMSPFHEDNEIITASTSAKKVFDVSGAGDTVLATIAACIATGLPIYQALELANIAAGVSVERVGTHAVTINELKNAIRLNNSTSYKNLSLAKGAAEIVNSWHNDGECIVFTNGCFDLFHAGHVKLLQNAKGEGSKLIIGLNSDDSVRRLKGIGRPIINQTDRAAVLTALDCVDLVVVFNEDTPIDLIKQFRPHVICKGSDYTKEEVIGQEIVESWGGKVILIPLVSDLSTTEILLRIHGSSEKSNPIIDGLVKTPSRPIKHFEL
jgi:D-beta-D-heptose 7-phosphate kinase/D-beta-D-heptose 1-phosphate adenosyltransferase